MENARTDSDAVETINIVDSRGKIVRAVTLPVTMARPRSEISSTRLVKSGSVITEGRGANAVDTSRNHQYYDEKAGWNPQEHAGISTCCNQCERCKLLFLLECS